MLSKNWKRLKKYIFLPSLVATTFFVFSCSFISPIVAPEINIPARPQLIICPEKPDVEAHIVNTPQGKMVLLSLEQAEQLRTWMESYAICAESNQAVLEGHIEKLENRLKAVGGK